MQSGAFGPAQAIQQLGYTGQFQQSLTGPVAAVAPLAAPLTADARAVRHVDSTLMVRNHHRDKIRIDIAGRLYRHVVHHFSHGGIVLDQEGGFRTDTGCRADVRIGHWEQLGRRKEGGSDDE
jgi:hypothetical protein